MRATTLTILALPLSVAVLASYPAPAAAQSSPQRAQGVQACTFQSLSRKDQDRYRSRYQRRVRVDGQAYADRWLREEACPTQTELAAQKARASRRKNCRAVSRPVTSLDGSMTVGIGRKCD